MMDLCRIRTIMSTLFQVKSLKMNDLKNGEKTGYFSGIMHEFHPKNDGKPGGISQKGQKTGGHFPFSGNGRKA
jgi:hypothetical protein